MNTHLPSVAHDVGRAARLTNTELLARVKHLVRNEREVTANLVAHLAEIDRRRLYLGEGCSSLFTYCTQVLHLSEHAAYARIQAARSARKFPVVLEMLACGAINLTTLGLLAPHLTQENHRELLASARHKSKRQVEELVAHVRPQPDVAASIRKLPVAPAPAPATASASATPSSPAAATTPGAASAPGTAAAVPPRAGSRAVVAALSAERYKIQFTVDASTHAKLRRAQDLLRHQVPDGDPAAVIDRALTVLLENLERQKLAAAARPRSSRPARPGSRHIPAVVRRAVWLRDGGRCAFVGADRRRCSEQGFLEFHHVRPFGTGGESTVENIELRCRAHNQYEANLYFGVKSSEDSMVRETAVVYAPFSRGGLVVRALGPDPVGVDGKSRVGPVVQLASLEPKGRRHPSCARQRVARRRVARGLLRCGRAVRAALEAGSVVAAGRAQLSLQSSV